jgi:hypothetical protein
MWDLNPSAKWKWVGSLGSVAQRTAVGDPSSPPVLIPHTTSSSQSPLLATGADNPWGRRADQAISGYFLDATDTLRCQKILWMLFVQRGQV